MLVLSRKAGQGIVIGKSIRIDVLRVNGRVKLGITAPGDVVINRIEVETRIAAGEPRRRIA